jgi:hypothetical protein
MHSETHRARVFFLSVLLALLGLMLFARPAHSAWSADPVQVHATTALCPLVAACDDAHFGAILTWQENTGSGGVLKAQHLLANGDVDPAWGAGVDVCTALATRAALGALSDGTGGAYVWWMEDATLFLTRVSPTGAIADGWPARGSELGTMVGNRQRPGVAGDGSGGIYLAWLNDALGPPTAPTVYAVHLGPENTGKGGWPGEGRVLGSNSHAFEMANAAAIASAPDGGLWLAFATTTRAGGVYGSGDVRIVRLTSAGDPAVGWDAHGVSLAPFRGDLLTNSPAWGPEPGMSPVAVADDGGSGAFVVSAEIEEDADGVSPSAYTLRRVGSDGSTAAGWAAGGIVVGSGTYSPYQDPGAGSSLRAMADGHGGVFAGTPGFYTEGLSVLAFGRWSGTGTALPGGLTSDQFGIEYASRGDGGMYIASFYPTGPTSYFSPNAYISAAQSAPGGGFFEYHDTPVLQWYGDVTLAATGDGGAVFAWSQVNQRFGIFAVRLGPAGQVTGVPPTVIQGPPSMRLRFVPGIGVRALIASVPSGREELALHDVGGRLVARTTIEQAAGGDWVFPGTERLPSGLYFARAVSGGMVLKGRVAVIR